MQVLAGFVGPMEAVFVKIMTVFKQVSILFGPASSAEITYCSFKCHLSKIKISKTFLSLQKHTMKSPIKLPGVFLKRRAKALNLSGTTSGKNKSSRLKSRGQNEVKSFFCFKTIKTILHIYLRWLYGSRLGPDYGSNLFKI